MVAPQCFITCIIILMIMFLDRVITGVECDRDAPRIELGISHLCSCTHHRVHCHCLSNSLPDFTQSQPGFSLSQFIGVVQNVVQQDDNLIPK